MLNSAAYLKWFSPSDYKLLLAVILSPLFLRRSSFALAADKTVFDRRLSFAPAHLRVICRYFEIERST